MLAALAGVLIAPILPQFTPVALTLLVITAYAAAMVGRLRSLPLTFLGAVILGELEYLLAFIDTKRIGGDTVADLAKDLQASAPVILLFLVLIVLPEDRVASRSSRRYRAPKPTLRTVALAMVAYLAVCFVIVQSGWVSVSTIDELGKGIALGIVMLSLVLAHRVRGADLAGPARLRRHRRGHGLEARARRRSRGRGGDRGRGRRARGPARAEDARPLPGPRHDGLRLVHRGEPLRRQPVFQQMLPFSLGNATADRFPGFRSDTVFFMAMAVVFALVVLLLTVIRNGPFGRRLQAMRDSPAACVTLGLDLTATKLQVVRPLGRHRRARRCAPGHVEVLERRRERLRSAAWPLPGLALVLVAVVGGITTVFGPLFGGFVFVMMPLIGSWYPALSNTMNLLPGLAGIGLGQNPDGIVGQVAEAIGGARGASATRPARHRRCRRSCPSGWVSTGHPPPRRSRCSTMSPA